jgi:hypothetical protein
MDTTNFNRKSIKVGESIDLTLEIRNNLDSLVNSQNEPTYKVYSPDLTLYAKGSGNLVSTGLYNTSPLLITPQSQVSSDWKIVWEYRVDNIDKMLEEYFVVTPENSSNLSLSVSIDSNTFARIKAIIGYPYISDSLTIDDEQIKEICLIPAFQVYYSKFPIENIEQYAIAGELSLDFPTSNTFGVKDCRVINKIAGNSQFGASNFWQLLAYKQIQGQGKPWNRSGYSTPYNFNGISDLWDMRRQYFDSNQNRLNTFKYKVDHTNRKLLSYSSLAAMLEVNWATYSYNIQNIKFTLKETFIKLAQYYLLMHFVDVGSLFTPDENTTNRLDVDKLKTRADALYEEVKTKFNEYPTIVLLRGE